MEEAVAKLKEEGNAHFLKKEYLLARDKYTNALTKGGDNAILYANRAACYIGLGKYLDARSDAKKATRADPKYIKGWGRLAVSEQNLANWEFAIVAYGMALELLSSKTMGPGEMKLMRQYSAGLEVSREKQKSKDIPAMAYDLMSRMRLANEGEMPWDCAKKLTSSSSVGPNSSAWVVREANQRFNEFWKGLSRLALVKEDLGPPSVFSGKQGVLEAFSDAILMDSRAFALDLKLFYEKYNDHLVMEMVSSGAWTDAGPDFVIEDAQKRVQTLGWETTRLALSVTVRAWIIRAYLSAGIDRDTAVALQFYEGAFRILERGREVWKDVPLRDRGIIFEETFIRGLRVLLAQEHMNAITANIPDYTVEALLEKAEKLYDDTEKARVQCTSKYSRGFFQAFFVYPAAEALSIKAFCLKKLARQKPESEAFKLIDDSARFYWQAAQKFPDDDEYCCYYITVSLTTWWNFNGVPISTVLPRLERLKECYPKMLRIWKNSGTGIPGRDNMIKNCLDYYETLRKKLRTGELNKKSVYNPDFKFHE